MTKKYVNITMDEETDECFRGLLTKYKISKNVFFKEIIYRCMNDVSLDIKPMFPYIDNIKFLKTIWDISDKMTDKNGNKMLWKIDVINYLIAQGYSKSTALTYLYIKHRKNQMYACIQDGLVTKRKDIYIIKTTEDNKQWN